MKNGMMDGFGIYTYSNGDVYEGEFKENYSMDTADLPCRINMYMKVNLEMIL